jgi:NAD(P)-dependent dehydrogenase (short-subunit alcohol dehydrogenase family)
MSEKLAIVTGSSAGIGEALAGQLLAAGWAVLGIARSEVKRSEPGYKHIQADLGDAKAIDGIIAPRLSLELAFASCSRLALVNNAAAPGQMRSFGRQSAPATYQTIAINLAACMALTDMAVRLRPEGVALRVVNVSSGLAYRPLAGAADYCASKAGLHMAGEVLACEEHPNVGVLSYAPGIVDTGMQKRLRGQPETEFASVEVFKAMHDEGRLAAPDDVVAPMVAFLESDQCGFFEDRYEPSASVMGSQ